MWLKSLLCLVLAAFSIAANAQPKIRVTNPIHEFGTVVEGASVAHAFQIQNLGDEPLAISRVLSSCGCTVAKNSSDILQPGGSSLIEVKFNTAGFAGERKKAIRLYSNDPENPMVPLYLQGIIQPEIVVEPRRVAFKGVSKDQLDGVSAKVVIRVAPQADSAVQIEQVRALSKRVKVVDLGGDTKSRQIEVRLSSDLTIGEFRDRVLVELSGGQSQIVNVPVSVEIVGDVRLNPSVVSFGLLQGEAPVVRTVVAENLSGRPLTLASVEANSEAISVNHKQVANSQNYEIFIKLNPALIQGEQFKGQVKLGFDRPGYSEMVLNIYGVRPPLVK
jgi:hypothetical protein